MLEKSTLVLGKSRMGSKTRGSKTRWKGGIQSNAHEFVGLLRHEHRGCFPVHTPTQSSARICQALEGISRSSVASAFTFASASAAVICADTSRPTLPCNICDVRWGCRLECSHMRTKFSLVNSMPVIAMIDRRTPCSRTSDWYRIRKSEFSSV